MLDETWIDEVAACWNLDSETRHELSRSARSFSMPAGSHMFDSGGPCQGFIFLLEGTVRVRLIEESGKEIVLYRVGPGSACFLTSACLFSGEDYPSDGIAETDVRALVLPPEKFDSLLAKSETFRALVFSGFGDRISDLMKVIGGLLFRRVEVRLAQALLDRADEEGNISLTHQALATELGTAREVVSRHLKAFAEKGWVSVGRGGITVLDVAALKNMAEINVM